MDPSDDYDMENEIGDGNDSDDSHTSSSQSKMESDEVIANVEEQTAEEQPSDQHSVDNEENVSSTAHTPLMDEPGEEDSCDEDYASPDEEPMVLQPQYRSSLKPSKSYSPDHSSHYMTAQGFPDMSTTSTSGPLPATHISNDPLEEEQLDYDEEMPTTSGGDTTFQEAVSITPKEVVNKVKEGNYDALSSASSDGGVSESGNSSSEEGECDEGSSDEGCLSEVEDGELPSTKSKKRGKKTAKVQSETEEGECEVSDTEPATNTANVATVGDAASKTTPTVAPTTLAAATTEDVGEEDPWLKAVRLAKERLKKAKELKEKEKEDLDQKKLNMNLLHVEEVNVVKPLSESKVAHFIGNAAASHNGKAMGAQKDQLSAEMYIPVVPKKNEMLLEYYLNCISDQENWRFIGKDLNEVAEWQRREYPSEWVKQFMRLSIHKKAAVAQATGAGRRRRSVASSLTSRSGTGSSSSSRSSSSAAGGRQSASSSRSSPARSSSSSSVLTSRSSSSSSQSRSSSASSRTQKKHNQPRSAPRRNANRPDPATIYRSIHPRNTLADLRHQGNKPATQGKQRSPLANRNQRSPSPNRNNRYGYNQGRRGGNRPSPVYSPSGRKRAPTATTPDATTAAAQSGAVSDKKIPSSGGAAAIDPQLEARLSQWRAQPAPAGGADEQQWRDPWERRSRAPAPTAAQQPAGNKTAGKPLAQRSPVEPRASSSSRSSSMSRSSASSSSSSSSSRASSVKSTSSHVKPGSRASSASGSSSSSASSSASSRSSRSSGASPKSPRGGAPPRTAADSASSKLKIGAGDEHLVSTSSHPPPEEKSRASHRQEVKLHLASKKRPLVMGRSAHQLEDEAEEDLRSNLPLPTQTVHLKSGLPLSMDMESPSGNPIGVPAPKPPAEGDEAPGGTVAGEGGSKTRHRHREDKAHRDPRVSSIRAPHQHKIIGLEDDEEKVSSKRHEKKKHSEGKRSHHRSHDENVEERGRHYSHHQSQQQHQRPGTRQGPSDWGQDSRRGGGWSAFRGRYYPNEGHRGGGMNQSTFGRGRGGFPRGGGGGGGDQRRVMRQRDEPSYAPYTGDDGSYRRGGNEPVRQQTDNRQHRGRDEDNSGAFGRGPAVSKIPMRTGAPPTQVPPPRGRNEAPMAPVAGQKRPREVGPVVDARTSGGTKSETPAAPVVEGGAAGTEKKAVKRREELLQQLAMVEDAIAKKRAKMSGSTLIK